MFVALFGMVTNKKKRNIVNTNFKGPFKTNVNISILNATGRVAINTLACAYARLQNPMANVWMGPEILAADSLVYRAWHWVDESDNKSVKWTHLFFKTNNQRRNPSQRDFAWPFSTISVFPGAKHTFVKNIHLCWQDATYRNLNQFCNRKPPGAPY